MCARYYNDENTVSAVRSLVQEIGDSFGRQFRLGDVHPSEPAPVLTAGEQGMSARVLNWGFRRFDGKTVIINAGSETAPEKPMFRNSVRKRRCVIPARWFYEWDEAKNKVTFEEREEGLLLLAGFYKETLWTRTQRSRL